MRHSSFFDGHSKEWTHTHTRLTALCPGLPEWAGNRKAKPIWILLKQETVSGSGISWAICKSAPRSRQITTSAPHRSVFFTGRMPFLPPNHNSVKALKAKEWTVVILLAHKHGLPEICQNVTYNIHSKFHNAAGRTVRRVYCTWVSPHSRLTCRVKT